MPPVQSCLHCQFLSHVLKALFFSQNSPKMKIFLQKNAKFSSAGGSAPRSPKQPPPIANFWLRACQEALVARVLNMNDITNIVIKCVNFIKKTGLSHHQF